MARHEAIRQVLKVLSKEGSETYAEKDALTLEIVVEQRMNPSSFWTAVLLVAYYPMLSRLRHRIWGDAFLSDDLDQLVVTGFLTVVAEFPIESRRSHTAVKLRQRTERFVFGMVRQQQRERRKETLVEPEELEFLSGEPWPETKDKGPPSPRNAIDSADAVSFLVEQVGDMVDGQTFDMVTATLVCGRRVSFFLDQLRPGLSQEERRLAYERIRKHRSRTLTRIRPEVVSYRGPHFAATAFAYVEASSFRR